MRKSLWWLRYFPQWSVKGTATTLWQLHHRQWFSRHGQLCPSAINFQAYHVGRKWPLDLPWIRWPIHCFAAKNNREQIFRPLLLPRRGSFKIVFGNYSTKVGTAKHRECLGFLPPLRKILMVLNPHPMDLSNILTSSSTLFMPRAIFKAPDARAKNSSFHIFTEVGAERTHDFVAHSLISVGKEKLYPAVYLMLVGCLAESVNTVFHPTALYHGPNSLCMTGIE